MLIVLASLLLLASVVVLASRGQYDPFSGTWLPTSPTDSYNIRELITQMVVAKTQAGWEETLTYTDGKTSSLPMKRLSANLLVTLAPPALGGFALYYDPRTDRLVLGRGGPAPGPDFGRMTSPPTTTVL
jgi:hypothetical protein